MPKVRKILQKPTDFQKCWEGSTPELRETLRRQLILKLGTSDRTILRWRDGYPIINESTAKEVATIVRKVTGLPCDHETIY